MNKALIVSLIALAVAPAAVANTSYGACGEPGSSGIIDTGAGIYIDARGPNQGTWIYQESNGLPGLQRGGASSFVPDNNERCIDEDETGAGADTLIVGVIVPQIIGPF